MVGCGCGPAFPGNTHEDKKSADTLHFLVFSFDEDMIKRYLHTY